MVGGWWLGWLTLSVVESAVCGRGETLSSPQSRPSWTLSCDLIVARKGWDMLLTLNPSSASHTSKGTKDMITSRVMLNGFVRKS